jgi:hypothetical protein
MTNREIVTSFCKRTSPSSDDKQLVSAHDAFLDFLVMPIVHVHQVQHVAHELAVLARNLALQLGSVLLLLATQLQLLAATVQGIITSEGQQPNGAADLCFIFRSGFFIKAGGGIEKRLK